MQLFFGNIIHYFKGALYIIEFCDDALRKKVLSISYIVLHVIYIDALLLFLDIVWGYFTKSSI